MVMCKMCGKEIPKGDWVVCTEIDEMPFVCEKCDKNATIM